MRPLPITEAHREPCVTWIGDKYTFDQAEELAKKVHEGSIVFHSNKWEFALLKAEFAPCEDPKLAFFIYCDANFRQPSESPIIGKGCDIHPSAVIYPNVIIGDHVTIKANAVIGGNGFGFYKGMKLPHYGRVIIGNYCHIGSCTCIDRGTLGDTIIKDDVHIDNLCHIAHNVKIGYGSTIIANSMIAGSVEIGAGSWVAPSASIRNGVTIGIDSTVGIGAVVVKSLPKNSIVMGNPAEDAEEFKATRKKIKAL